MLDWNEAGEPISRRYGDRYFSAGHGARESEAVFLSANRLPDRFLTEPGNHFAVGELGFGTGLNFVLTAEAWIRSGAASRGKRLLYLSTERDPLSSADLERAWRAIAEGDPALRSRFLSLGPARFPREKGFHWRGYPDFGIELRLLVGDARETLAALPRAGDPRCGVRAWYLDGFAPSKNPELWEEALFRELARLSAPGATFGTYSSSGRAKDALRGAGFSVERVEGFAGKKHRLVGSLPACGEESAALSPPARVHVVGGGIAGAASAFSFARRGISVTLWEREAELATRASGNPASLLKPPANETSADFRHRFHRAGFGATRALWERLTGESSARGWCVMRDWIEALLGAASGRVELRLGSSAPSLAEMLADSGAHAVLATGTARDAFPEARGVPVWGVRGQLAEFTKPPCAGAGVERAGKTYWIAEMGVAGATVTVRDPATGVRPEENERIWESLAEGLPGFAASVPRERQDFTRGRVGFRPVCPDAFPSVGELPGVPRAWILAGLGAKGLAGSLLAAEHLAARAFGEIPVVESEIARQLDPARHLAREMRRAPQRRSPWWQEMENEAR